MKAKHIKKILLFTITLFLLGLYSCVKQEINTDDIVLEEYSPTVALSIGNADFVISDITGNRGLESNVVSFLESIYPDFDYDNYTNSFNSTVFPFIVDSKNVNYALKFPFSGDDFFNTTDSVKQFQMKFQITNGIPTKFNTQIYFLDENDVLIDSLLSGSNQVFKGGSTIIETNGVEIYHKLTSAEKKIVTIGSLEKLSILKESKSIIIRFSGKEMPETNKVLIEETNFLKFKIGILIEDDITDNI